MTAVDRRFFESLMASRKLSMRALAAKMDRTHSQLSLIFSGQRRMQLDEAAMLADLLGAPLNRIAEAAGVARSKPTNGRRVSVIGAMGSSGIVDIYPSDVMERTAAPPGESPERLIAVQARTADTAASWLDGFVFFSAKTEVIEPDAVGRFCLVKITDGDTVLAAVRRGYRDGTFNLSGPFSGDSKRLDWASPVIHVRT